MYQIQIKHLTVLNSEIVESNNKKITPYFLS